MIYLDGNLDAALMDVTSRDRDEAQTPVPYCSVSRARLSRQVQRHSRDWGRGAPVAFRAVEGGMHLASGCNTLGGMRNATPAVQCARETWARRERRLLQ